MAHPNEEVVRRGFEAFSTGDMAALNDLFADDIVWHAPGRNPLSGDHKGKEAVFETFRQLFEMTGGTFKVELHDVLAHSLSGAAIQLQGARKLAEREQASPPVRAAIERAGELVRDGLANA